MKIYLVGGAVRDKLLGLPVRERDWVVVDAAPNDMLSQGYQQVGKEFPVFLHPKTNEEYALARTERKIGPGYKGFTFDTSKHVTLEEDLSRRDLTINAMAESSNGQIIDPYHGQRDLEQKYLRHVSLAFSEDPVRILRIGRFLARFHHLGFRIAPETMQLMKTMVTSGEVNALVPERVWKELERALGEKNPEQFFNVLTECEALPILFPELALHSNGLAALKRAASLETPSLIRFAVLWHDVAHGKQTIKQLCQRYRVPKDYQELALLVAAHYQNTVTASNLSAESLLDLLYALDIFRRYERFQHFLTACDLIAAATHHPFDKNYLAHAATMLKTHSIQPIINQGLDGTALANAIKQDRREQLQHWLTHEKPTEK